MTEHQLQISVVNYLTALRVKFFAIPNGGNRNALTGLRLKREGVKAGVPDIFICEPMTHYGEEIKYYSGFFLELKVGKNKTSASQQQWLQDLHDRGYYTSVCYSLDDVIKEIGFYFNQKQVDNRLSPAKRTDVTPKEKSLLKTKI